jgi:pyruvate-formate lyase
MMGAPWRLPPSPVKGTSNPSPKAALEGSPFLSGHAEPFFLERRLTAIHRAHEGGDPVERELAFLRGQFPAVLRPPAPGDLFAGRIAYPLVSFSPEPGGLGYACRAAEIRSLLEHDPLPASDRAAVEEMLGYWETRTTAAKTRAAFAPLLQRTLPSDAWTQESCIAFPLYRLAGTVLDYGKLLRAGLPGLRAEIESARGAAGPGQRDFLSGLLQSLSVLENSCGFYAHVAQGLSRACAEGERRAELERIHRSLLAITRRAPATLHEAIQLAWLYALHAGTWNYGRADAYLGAFLERDLAQKTITEAGALRLLQGWWRLMKAYDNQFNNRVIVGGRGRGSAEEEAAADRFALLAIEATRTVRLNQPQLSLRFYRGQDPALMERALDAIGEGATFPILYNDDVNIPAVAEAFGFPEEEAAQYVPYGCGEGVLPARSVSSPNAVINLAKCLEAALHGGTEPWRAHVTGPASPLAGSFRRFEDLWGAYAAQVEHHAAACAQHQGILHEVAAREAPFLLLSALHDDCIAAGRPLLSGGVRYLGGTLETYGNTNAADALHAVDELVYRQGRLTLAEIVNACDADFAGAEHERVRRLLLSAGKYGNDDDAADAIARRVHEHVCRCTRAQAGLHGLHHYLVVVINNWANVILGATTGATPDGRKSGDPLANGNNPSPGADKKAVTAFLNSLVKLQPQLHAGAVQNMKFSRELFGKNRPQLEALLRVYWERGGTQAMITVVSQDDLRAAMREPEKWGHLMVRVGGFSARFVDLPRTVQEEILRRTAHE